jgi:hypothetical protein
MQEGFSIDDEDSLIASVKNMNITDLYRNSCCGSSIVRKSEYRQSVH